MKFKKILLASLIYMVWSFLIGYFVSFLAGWATLIAALASGIYVGHGSKPGEGFTWGIIAGLIGGFLGGTIMLYAPSFMGIPLKVSTSEIISPALNFVEESFPWTSNLALVLIGAIFGGVGGTVGSSKKLETIFLLSGLFLLYIFYGAVDNAAWNWTTPGWTWNMSISHVLTNSIDLLVAIVFALVTTLSYYLLNLHKESVKNLGSKDSILKIIYAAAIYMVWSVLTGYFIPYLIPWAVIIAAIVAGAYAGFKCSKSNAIINGLMAGLIGGIALGTVSVYTTNIAGIPLSVSIANFLIPIVNIVTASFPWLIIPSLAIVGSLFGALGGFVGSIGKFKNIFLFLTLFTLFIFYAALDNLAWWWGKADWTWTISVVLTHWIDLSIAFLFALFITILYNILKVKE